ncbi:MAG: hypothetical protein HQL27_05530 [Candidatus Omnitrophica bacterium]|nr:hypothetical protein [Candidatus Omnitrophota bacterium]
MIFRIKNIRSFTLLELLIVVIVMMILAGFIIPSYSRMQALARERVAADSLSMVVEEINRHRAQNRGEFPEGEIQAYFFKNPGWAVENNFQNVHLNLQDGMRITCCPASLSCTDTWNPLPNVYDPITYQCSAEVIRWNSGIDDYEFEYQLFTVFDSATIDNNYTRKPLCNEAEGLCPSCTLADGCPWYR